jgi:exodeoxyribonuclease VII small subunit
MPQPPDEPTGYEEARAALADVVSALESGDLSLEEALDLWERGEAYANQCEQWLRGAQERLDAARVDDATESPTALE